MAAVDDKSGGRSMAVGAFNDVDDGQLRGDGEAAGGKRKMQTQQSIEGGGGLRTPSDAFRRAKRRWRGVCGISVMETWDRSQQLSHTTHLCKLILNIGSHPCVE